MDEVDETFARAAYGSYRKSLLATGLTVPMEFEHLPKALKVVWLDVSHAVLEAERLMERGK